MPLIVTGAPGPPAPTLPPDPLPPTTAPDSPVVSWTPAGGDFTYLSETLREGILLGGVGGPRTITGLDMPPEEQFDTDLGPTDGQFMNHRRFAARLFSLPIIIHSDKLSGTDDDPGLEQYRRELIAAFNPARGEGRFTVAYPDGSRRHLMARYQSGLEGTELGRQGGPLYFDSYTVVLKARDPFPFGEEQEITFDPPVSGEFFAPPGSGHVVFISSSRTTGDRDVFIDGDVKTSPVAEMRGPCTTATWRNRDTGQALALTPNIPAGQGVRVNMDPRTPPREKIQRGTVVELSDGSWSLADLTNVWASTAGQFPVMWALRPGMNRVTVTLNGTVSGQSQGRLLYTPRYLSA